MKKALICVAGIIFLSISCSTANGQNIGMTSSTSGITKTCAFWYIPPFMPPPDNSQYPFCKPPKPFSTLASLFIEYGDGNFSLNNCNFTNNYVSSPGASSSKVVLKATGIYDGGPRPKRFFTTVVSGTTMAKSCNFPQIPASSIKITASSEQLVPGDENVFAVTIKINRPGELLFFYDDIDHPVFNQVSGTTTVSATKNDGSNENIPAVRTYNNGTVINPFSASPAAQLVITDYSDRYSKYVLLSVPTPVADTQRNVFITLPVNTNAPIDSTASVKAIFIPSLGPALEYSINDMLVMASRDPNNIKSNPLCTTFDRTTNIINYRVNFQNMGNTSATDIVITIDLAKEMLIPNQIPLAVYLQGNPLRNTDAACSSTGFFYWVNPQLKQLTIRICRVSLRGLEEHVPDEKETKGYVLFKLRINPSYLATRLERNLKARASIVFNTNEPVVTDPAFVSVKDDCTPCKKPAADNCCCNGKKNTDDPKDQKEDKDPKDTKDQKDSKDAKYPKDPKDEKEK